MLCWVQPAFARSVTLNAKTNVMLPRYGTHNKLTHVRCACMAAIAQDVDHIGQVIRMRPILRLHVALAHYTIEQKAAMSQSSISQVVP